MKVIRIKSSAEDASMIKRTLESADACNSIFILDSTEHLYKFIEDLDMNGSLLYNLKIANEIDFTDISVEFRDKITDAVILKNIICLSNLLEAVDEEQIKECRLIIDSEDNDLISKVAQAMLYLNIDMEIMMLREKKDRKIIDAFRKEFEGIRASVINGEKAIYNLYTKDDFVNEKNNILNTLYKIDNDLEKARERALNIAVLATKKAGKSVVVNSFLDEQYAPTSFELPTPNSCIYKRSKDDNIRLIYGENDILFKNPQEIYKYIYKEFKRAQNDKEHGYTIDDMEIYYTDHSGSFAPYTVIDTPGSNYVAAMDKESGENIHKKLACTWILKSDVVLFLINYSSYLTIDEEEFIRNIKSQFEKFNKFYSLVIVINKLDEMYISECENKSVVRFLDYIRCKLYDLGYKGFVVMGVSARSYFDLIKVERIDSENLDSIGKKVPVRYLKGSDLRERLKKLKGKYIGKAEMSSLSFVDDQLEKLECFYGLKNYDLNTLREKSGIPTLKNYTSYIAVQKANVELYSRLIRDIDEKYADISNNLIINSLTNAWREKTAEIKNIEFTIYHVMGKFDFIRKDMSSKLGFKEFKDELLKDVQISVYDVLQHMLDLWETRVDEFFMRLMLKDSYELKQLKNKNMDINFSVDNRLFDQEIKNVIDMAVNNINIELGKKVRFIRNAENNMKEVVKTFSFIIKKEYDIKDFSITLPEIDLDFKNKLLINMPEMDIINDEIKAKILDSIELERNVVKRLFNSLSRNRSGSFIINTRHIQKIKNEYIQYMRDKGYDIYYNLLEQNLCKCIDEYEVQINEIFKGISEFYENIFSDMLKELSASKFNSENQLKLMDSRISFYNEIEKIIKEFIDEWKIIRNASVS